MSEEKNTHTLTHTQPRHVLCKYTINKKKTLYVNFVDWVRRHRTPPNRQFSLLSLLFASAQLLHYHWHIQCVCIYIWSYEQSVYNTRKHQTLMQSALRLLSIRMYVVCKFENESEMKIQFRTDDNRRQHKQRQNAKDSNAIYYMYSESETQMLSIYIHTCILRSVCTFSNARWLDRVR